MGSSSASISSFTTPPLTVSDFDLDAVPLAAGGGPIGLEVALAIIAELDTEGVRFENVDDLQLAIATRWQTEQAVQWMINEAKKEEDQSSNVPSSTAVAALPLLLTALGCASSDLDSIQAAVRRMLSHGMGGVDPALPLADVLRALLRQPVASFLDGDPPKEAFLMHAIRELARRMRMRVLARHLQSSPSTALLLNPLPPQFTQEELRDLLGASHHSLFWSFRHFHHLHLQQQQLDAVHSIPGTPSASRSLQSLIERVTAMHRSCTDKLTLYSILYSSPPVRLEIHFLL